MKFENKKKTDSSWTTCEDCFCEYGRAVQKYIYGIYDEEYKTITFYNLCYGCAEKRVKKGPKNNEH